jgi:predicted transcriptional regulator
MTRVDTLPTLPESSLLFGEEPLDGWMFDTEPGTLPPDASAACERALAIAVGDLARYGLHCIPPAATLEEITRAVFDSDGAPVVVVDAGRPVGIVRPLNLLRALGTARAGRELRASAIMSSSLFCLPMDVPASRALELLTERGAQEVGVVDAAGMLIGIVMPVDMARALAGGTRNGTIA